jgi:catechol 2,3-dioxygenase-like lactoylglutathione lyase family enzyme
MTTTIAMITLDCAEVTPVADFWKEALGYEQVASDGESYAMLKGGSGPALGLGKVEDYEPPGWPNPHGSKQFHLDLAADDIDAETERLVGLGATLADPQPGETWRVLLDPAGHPFCVTNSANWG